MHTRGIIQSLVHASLVIFQLMYQLVVMQDIAIAVQLDPCNSKHEYLWYIFWKNNLEPLDVHMNLVKIYAFHLQIACLLACLLASSNHLCGPSVWFHSNFHLGIRFMLAFVGSSTSKDRRIYYHPFKHLNTSEIILVAQFGFILTSTWGYVPCWSSLDRALQKIDVSITIRLSIWTHWKWFLLSHNFFMYW